MWEQVKVGQPDLVMRFEELAEKMKGKRMESQVVQDEAEEWSTDDDDAMDEEDEEVPQLIPTTETRPSQKNEPEVDGDGFTLVKRGKGGR